MTELVLGSLYTLPGKGTVIYCGLKNKLAKFRFLSAIDKTTYIASEYVSILRPCKHGTYLSGQDMHDNLLLHVSDKMLMQNKNAVLIGTIKYLYGSTCDFVCKGKTQRISLSKVFIYEQSLTEDLCARAVLRSALQGQDQINTQPKIPKPSRCEMA